MSHVGFLRNVPVLADLPDALLEGLSGEVTERTVRAGAWILREGEPGDSVFIVRSGRVEVVDEGPPEMLIRILRRGDVLGELALLRQAPRSASARARRDTQLLELRREAFERLIHSAPDFALGLVRSIGAQLAASRTPLFHVTPPRTIGVIGLDAGVDAAAMARRLAEVLGGFGSVAELLTGEMEVLDRAVASSDRVVLSEGPDSGAGWLELCLQEADLLVAVTSGRPDRRWLERPEPLQGCELMVIGPALAPGALSALAPREAQVIAGPDRLEDALAMLGRRLAGRSLGIVLSGGGARAFAHIGVIAELQAAGLRFDRISGVSLGSLIAAGVASDYDTDYIRDACRRNFVESRPTRDFAPPIFSIIRGAKVRGLLRDQFGETLIEQLPRRFFCVTCDLVAREAVVFRTGRLTDALYASLAIPGVFPPVASGERLLVDGGVIDNLPVETMARSGEGPLIAVDVGGRSEAAARGQRAGLRRLESSARLALTGSDAAIPRLSETLVRTMMVGSADTTAAARIHADVVIAPDVDGIALMDWNAMDRSIERGREAARAALDRMDLPSLASI